jgi:hypothetical protein
MGSHWRSDGAPKSTFRSQGEALGAADERSFETGVSLKVYQCGFCRGWHMASVDGRER